MGCLSCARGFCVECKKCKKGKCHTKVDESKIAVLRGVGRPLKEIHEMKDAASTGRKRAATLYPLFKDQPCEWQGKKNCGGGKHPIVGCIDGLQQARHHGPIKDTRRNDPNNVHRISTDCHNRWHTLNDAVYDETLYSTLPHVPEFATFEELVSSKVWWSTKKIERIKAD